MTAFQHQHQQQPATRSIEATISINLGVKHTHMFSHCSITRQHTQTRHGAEHNTPAQLRRWFEPLTTTRMFQRTRAKRRQCPHGCKLILLISWSALFLRGERYRSQEKNRRGGERACVYYVSPTREKHVCTTITSTHHHHTHIQTTRSQILLFLRLVPA